MGGGYSTGDGKEKSDCHDSSGNRLTLILVRIACPPLEYSLAAEKTEDEKRDEEE